MTERDPSLATILPHSYPFILIDKIIEREEGQAIVCLKNITFNENFLQGHFRDNPIIPRGTDYRSNGAGIGADNWLCT